MKQTILFIGAGNIAHAIEYLIKDNKDIAIDFWDKDTSKVPSQKPLEVLAVKADIIFLCIHSWVMREAILSIKSYIKKDSIILTVTKGIEDTTGFWVDEILEDLLPEGQSYGLLSGPMLAKEISAGLGGAAVVATQNKKLFEKIQSIFSDPSFHVEYSSDISGVAMSGVLKNIYAIGLGISEGLSFGSNMKGYLAMQSIKEMMDLVQKLGGRAETVLGPAGFGDFVATGFSPHSKNHTLGREIAQSGVFTEKSEGYSSLPQFLKKIDYKTEKYPILHMIRLVLLENITAKEAFRHLLQ